jgi:hypothetical protein
MDFTKLNSQLNEARRLAAPRTAILWGREDLFSEAVESLIIRMKNWMVTRISSDEYTAQDLMHEIDRMKPDIVIISRSNTSCEANLPYKLIENHPNLNILTISSESNIVEIYTRREVTLEGPTDLLSIIDQAWCTPSSEGGDCQSD